MSKILLGVSGSIAGMKAAQVVSSLVQKGHEVQVVATPAALRFVGAATWEGLTGRTVLSDVFSEGHQMDHIHLARWADLLILCPATANAIGLWANGLAQDLPSTIYLAMEKHKPVLVAPAMNREMWSHPAVQSNLATLRSQRVQIVGPAQGNLACGEQGDGRLVEADEIIQAIDSHLHTKSKGRVLVTAGGTREPIDGVRFITNVSSGATGAHLADAFSSDGWQVTYLHGQAAQLPSAANIELAQFSDFRSLQLQLQSQLHGSQFDFVVHAAAVSDFSLAEVIADGSGSPTRSGAKLASDQDLTLRLRRNPKLVLNLKEWSGRNPPYVIAFKLTDTDSAPEQQKAVDSLLDRAEVDAVVWNNLKDISPSAHTGKIFTKNEKPLQFSNKAEMADQLNVLMQTE